MCAILNQRRSFSFLEVTRNVVRFTLVSVHGKRRYKKTVGNKYQKSFLTKSHKSCLFLEISTSIMLWVNNRSEETWKKYFILMVALWYLKYIRLTAVANDLLKMYSTNTIAYFLPVEWTGAIIQRPRQMEFLPFSGVGCCSSAIFSFLLPRRRNSQDTPLGVLHGPSLGVAHITSMSPSTAGCFLHRKDREA